MPGMTMSPRPEVVSAAENVFLQLWCGCGEDAMRTEHGKVFAFICRIEILGK
jgi:hypothetical protein